MVIGKRPSVAACRLSLGAGLMKYIYEIMDLLKCTRDEAWKVFVEMDIDFSECTNEEFESEAKRIWEMVK